MIRVCGSDFPLPGVALTSRVEPLTYRAPKGYRQISGEVMTEAPHLAPPRWIDATGSGYPPGTDPTVFRPATRRTTRPVHAWKVILKISGSGTARPAPDPAEQNARIRSAENGRLRHALRDGYLAL